MRILEIVESVEAGRLEKHILLAIRELEFTLRYFGHFAAISYDSAIERLTSLSYPLEPMIVILAQNNRATVKLAAQYEELRQQALNKIRSGV